MFNGLPAQLCEVHSGKNRSTRSVDCFQQFCTTLEPFMKTNPRLPLNPLSSFLDNRFPPFLLCQRYYARFERCQTLNRIINHRRTLTSVIGCSILR